MDKDRLRLVVPVVILVVVLPASARQQERPPLRVGDVVDTIGVLTGDPAFVFGEVADVALDERGGLFVLDARFKELRRFDARGRFVAKTGGPGRGPGEYSAPRAVELGADGQVYTLDFGNARINRYDVTEEGLRLVHTIPARLPLYDMCLLGDRIFVLAPDVRTGTLIHKWSGEGERVRSFGAVYEPEEPMPERLQPLVRRFFSRGSLACVDRLDLIVYLPRNTADLRAFDADGNLVWRSAIQDYWPVEPELRPNGRVAWAPERDDRVAHRGIGVTWVVPAHVAVQLAVDDGDPESDASETDTRFISLETWREVAGTRDLPPISALSPSRVFSAVHDPYPRLLVFERRRP